MSHRVVITGVGIVSPLGLDADLSWKHIIKGISGIDKITSLRPAFDKDGSITAGNASTINDGAAALLISSQSAAKKLNVVPKAKIIAQASVAHRPEWFSQCKPA